MASERNRTGDAKPKCAAGGRSLHRMVRRIGSHQMLDANWKAHRFGRAHGIEILADECNLPVGYAEKNHIILSINAPGRF